MKKIFASFLILIAISATISCKKQNNPESRIESAEDTGDGEILFNVFYSFSRFDKLTYGVCWSDIASTPIRQTQYPLINDRPNFSEMEASGKSGNKEIYLNDIAGGVTLKARSYIKFEGGSTLYSPEEFLFKTKLFPYASCELDSNELIYGNGANLPITSTTTNYNYGFQIISQTNKYTITITFSEFPTFNGSYRIKQNDPYYDNEVQVLITEKIVNCGDFKAQVSADLYVNNIFDDVLYIQFCDVQMYRQFCTPSEFTFSGQIKVNL